MAELGPVGSGVRAVGTATWLSWRSARGIWLRIWEGDPLARGSLADAIGRFVWSPLPTLAALSGLVGIIVGVLGARILAVYNAELPVIGTLDETLLRQVLPLIVGVFASGGVAVELTSRLGAMSLAREVDALETMGVDPVAFILGPPIIAILVASPLHLVVAALAALIGTAVPLHLSANVPWHEVARIAFGDSSASALLVGIAKSFVFGWIAFAVGSTVGGRPVRVPADLGRRAGQAFTTGLIAIFTAATLWVALS